MKPEPALFTLPAPRLPHPDGGSLPQWLCEEINANHNPAHRPAAIWTRCPRCHEIILTGIDDPAIGEAATVDPTPLTPLSELACALAGRPTYRLHHTGTTARITRRTRWDTPAGTPRAAPVVPAHQCGARFPGLTIEPETERPHHDTPPF